MVGSSPWADVNQRVNHYLWCTRNQGITDGASSCGAGFDSRIVLMIFSTWVEGGRERNGASHDENCMN